MKKLNFNLSKLHIRGLIFSTMVGMALFIFACSDQSSIVPIEEVKTASSHKVAASGIPDEIDIFCPGGRSDRQSNGEFPSRLDKWYNETNSKTTQAFKLYDGDKIPRGNDPTDLYARSEVGGIGDPIRFSESSTYHGVQYTMKINIPKSSNGERLKETMTIAQLFAGCCGPQFRLEINPQGYISYGSRSNGNGTLLSDKDYSNNSNTLKVKMTSNGKFFRLSLNDKAIKFNVNGTLVDQLQTDESKKGTPNVLYHFRWGLYYNLPMYKDISATVTSISYF
jgi:hypothetical protein